MMSVKTEKKLPVQAMTVRFPRWTEEELLGLASLFAKDEVEFQFYKLYHYANSRLDDHVRGGSRAMAKRMISSKE